MRECESARVYVRESVCVSVRVHACECESVRECDLIIIIRWSVD